MSPQWKNIIESTILIGGGRCRESTSIPNKPLVSNHHSYHINQSIILWHRANNKIQLDATHTHAGRGYVVLGRRYTKNSTQKS